MQLQVVQKSCKLYIYTYYFIIHNRTSKGSRRPSDDRAQVKFFTI